MTPLKTAIIGSGNIGTDLMIKIATLSNTLEVAALVGIDPASDGLARAGRMGIAPVDTGSTGCWSSMTSTRSGSSSMPRRPLPTSRTPPGWLRAGSNSST